MRDPWEKPRRRKPWLLLFLIALFAATSFSSVLLVRERLLPKSSKNDKQSAIAEPTTTTTTQAPAPTSTSTTVAAPVVNRTTPTTSTTEAPTTTTTQALTTTTTTQPPPEPAKPRALEIPETPTGLTATPGDQQVTLRWNANKAGSLPTSYRVLFGKTDSPSASGRTTIETSCTVGGLQNGDTFNFVILAFNSDGESPKSKSVSAQPVSPNPEPGAPTNVRVVPGNGIVTVSWTAPASSGQSAISDYDVSIVHSDGVSAATGVTGAATRSVGSATTSLAFSGLTNGTAYKFKVSAKNTQGTGSFSSLSSAVTPRTIPGVPVSVTGTANNGAVTLTWTAPTSDGGASISDYDVSVFASDGVSAATGVTGATTRSVGSAATTFTFNGLTNGTVYKFKVAAKNVAGTSTASDSSASITPVTTPGVATGLSVTPGDASVALSWTAPSVTGGSAITDYEVSVFASDGVSAATGVTGAATRSVGSATTSFTFSGLTNGTAYTFKVVVKSSIGSGAPTAVTAATAPRKVPDAPTSLTGTAANAEVALSWAAPAANGAAITDYDIAVVDGDGTSAATGVTGTTTRSVGSSATTFTFSGLTNGTAYRFKVAAKNAAGTGAFSSLSAAVTPRVLAGAPTGLSGTAADSAVSLSWTAPSSNGGAAITDYEVSVFASDGVSAATGVTGGATRSVGSSATTFTFSGLTNGTAYRFKVAAKNAVGTGAFSTLTAAITPRKVPDAPTAVTGTAGNGEVALSWTAPAANGAAITDYDITVVDGDGTSAATGVTGLATRSVGSSATSFTFSGLTNGTSYKFKVAAKNAAGTGAFSSLSAAVTPRVLAGAPTGLSGTAADSAVSLSWTAPSSNGGAAITDYEVKVFASDGVSAATGVTGGVTRSVGSSATSFSFTGLTNGTSYTFKVAAKNVVGTGAFSALSAAVTPRKAPDAPTSVTGTSADSSVSLSWTAPSSNGGATITDYDVTVVHSDGTSAATGVTGAVTRSVGSSATSFTFTGLTNGTAYKFKVAAKNAAGTGAFSSLSAAVTPRVLAGAPTGLSGTAADSAVSLSWTAPSSNGGAAISDYDITVIDGDGTSAATGVTGTTTRSVGSAATTFSFTGLTNGTSYKFKVAAKNAVGTGAFSSLSAAVTPRKVPDAPTALSGTSADSSVSLSWTAPAANGAVITDYDITVVDGDGTSTATGVTGLVTRSVGSSATSFTFTGLTNGTSYKFKVAAKNAAGTGAFSSLSAAVTPRVLAGAPTGLSGTAADSAVSLSWTAPSSNGGAAITDYEMKVFASDGVSAATGVTGGVTRSVGSSATSFSFTGLTNGTAYTFKVAVKNAVGTGVASDPSAAITPRKAMELIFDVTENDNVVILPLRGRVNAMVDWGDGTTQQVTTSGGLSHTYATANQYSVKVLGVVSRFGTMGGLRQSGLGRLIEVKNFGTTDAISFSGAFSGASILTKVPTTLPSTVTDTSYMFQYASAFNQDIGAWNTSKVTNMRAMFAEALAFNQDISAWNTANVQDMSFMFTMASAFNQNISTWNTAKVVDFFAMFNSASSFNQPIGSWDMSSAVSISEMFSGASSFNQNIGSWNIANVTEMKATFFRARAFNQNISAWNTAKVTTMNQAFAEATSFNQDLSLWCVPLITTEPSQFSESATAWEKQDREPVWGSCPLSTTTPSGARGVTVTTTETIATVSWTAPVYSANSPITDYEVSVFAADGTSRALGVTGARTRSVGSVATTFEFTGLTSGQTYTFKVAARNANGLGRASYPSQPVTMLEPMKLVYQISGTPTIELPLTGPLNVDINWGDGVSELVTTGERPTHTYAAAGRYEISIAGTASGFSATLNEPAAGINQLTEVRTFGTLGLRTLSGAFLNASSLTRAPSRLPSTVTNLSGAFRGATSFNGDIRNWDTSRVTDMSFMFARATSFNNVLSGWNTSQVVTMERMFWGASKFNQAIGAWNTAKVTTMASMFREASAFNQDINNWSTSEVTNMSFMFNQASAFNQNLNSWNTANVTTMARMFDQASKFNGDITTWNTANVTDMEWMFVEAIDFNKNIGSWQTGKVVKMQGMFDGASDFDQNLSGWCVTNIAAEPSSFDRLTDAWVKTNRQPLWGTCPAVAP